MTKPRAFSSTRVASLRIWSTLLQTFQRRKLRACISRSPSAISLLMSPSNSSTAELTSSFIWALPFSMRETWTTPCQRRSSEGCRACGYGMEKPTRRPRFSTEWSSISSELPDLSRRNILVGSLASWQHVSPCGGRIRTLCRSQCFSTITKDNGWVSSNGWIKVWSPGGTIGRWRMRWVCQVSGHVVRRIFPEAYRGMGRPHG